MDEDEFGEQHVEEEEVLEQLDPNNPDHHFLIIERDFARTVGELEQNPELAQYAEEYNKLFETLYSTHTNEQQFQSRCMELEAKLVEMEQKLKITKQVTDVDAQTISELKSQIEHAWKMADTAHEREQMAQEMIEMLRKQVANLNAEIDFKNRMGQENSEELGAINKHREGLQREKEKLLAEVSKLTERLNNALTYQEELEKLQSEADLKIAEISGQLEDQSAEIDRHKRFRDKLEHEVSELKAEAIKKDNDISGLSDSLTANIRFTNKLEAQLKEQKLETSKGSKELELLHQKYSRLADEYDNVNYKFETHKKQYAKLANELKLRDEEVNRLNQDIFKAGKMKEFQEKKMFAVEKEKQDIIEERDKLRHIIHTLEKEIDKSKRSADGDKRTMEHMQREKEILNKNVLRHQAVARDHVKLLKLQQQTKRKLELEIDSYTMENAKQLKQISYLEKERDRLLEEELELTKKIEDTMEEVRQKKAEIYDLKKTLAENENKIRMQQNLFDVIRADRNALQKSLQESNAECVELKTKLKVSSHQTEQLKEDIAMKEQLLIKEENILRKVTKEKENLRVELNTSLDYIRRLKEEITEMTAEEKRLHKVISDGDKLIRQQAKDLEQLMNERDILGSQLVRRNDELSLLYEKIRILQTTLHRGEAQYDQRLEDIRLLKIEIKRLRQEKNLLTRSINNMTDLRQEVFHLERDLTRERLKCRALEDELQSPMNIHRWRKLEGSDPETLEMLQKIQLLQKRILTQSSVLLERERQLKEAERLYLNLRQVVSKQPGPEIQSQLLKTQKALSSKISKMKCLVSELNMAELQAAEYKQDLEKVNEELKTVKKKYLEGKKADQKRKEHATGPNETELLAKTSINSSQIKFAGGGFRMSVSSAATN